MIERLRFWRYTNVVIFAFVYAFLLSFYQPQLILTLTTTTGGDTGAHHYVAGYLRDSLLPRWQVFGWAPGWYAGFPMLQFYFPLAFILIAVMSIAIPYQVAFKIATILGVFLLPFTTYLAFRILKFEFPMPQLAALFTLPFLFLESYSIYGGNILSTLAGEFGYSLSFALMVPFLALVYTGIADNRHRLTAGILLSAVVLSHLITTIMAVLLMPFHLARKGWQGTLRYLLFVFGLAFFLTAFWGLPFLARLQYTAHMTWGQLVLSDLFPKEIIPLWPVGVLSVFGIIGALRNRDRRMLFFLWGIFVALALFFFLPPGRLWNGRFVPFFYYFVALFAAYGVYLGRKFFAFAAYGLTRLPKIEADYVFAVVIAIAVLSFTSSITTKAHGWIDWNYTGFELKPSWPALREINQYVAGLPPGRVMTEHSTNINKFGTERAFELLPYFAKQPTMEGTLMEASYSAPFHFVNQAELSKQASWAIQGVQYPTKPNVRDGIRHLRVFNIRYFIAISAEIKEAADREPGLKFLKKMDEFAIYEVRSPGGYVVIPKYEPLVLESSDWRAANLKWYGDLRKIDAPLIKGKATGPLSRFETVSENLDDFEKVPLDSSGRVSDVRLTDQELTFRTTAIGEPHWVKISYFPNWKVEGARGPYLASPSLMMVIPYRSNVRLYYGRTSPDWIGMGLTAFGFVTIAATLFVRSRWLRGAGWNSSNSTDAG